MADATGGVTLTTSTSFSLAGTTFYLQGVRFDGVGFELSNANRVVVF